MIARRLDPGETAPPVATPFDRVLEWLGGRDTFSVVQIGAFVGKTDNDPLYTFLTRTLSAHPASVVVLVEPVREYFEQLCEAYASLPTVKLENVAIAEDAGERDFYRLGVDPTDHGQPAWLSQLGSLDPTRMTTQWDRYEQEALDRQGALADLKGFWHEHRVVDRVDCVTLHQLVERHGIERLDLLQIDAEGYDYEILRSIDFSSMRPRFINYERVLLGEAEPDCRAMLLKQGYVLFDWDIDTLAVLLPD